MKKRRKTKIKKKTLAVIAFSIFIIIVISILSTQKTQTKPPAREYFKIEDAVAFVELNPLQNQTIKVKMLSFKITPIKGDAHYLSINPGGNVKYEDWPWFEKIECNKTVDLAAEGKEIFYGTTPLLARKTENGYAVTLRITCNETSDLPDDQKVTIYITELFSS
ncbi:MAG: hypothetical protein QME50_00075 [Candidatus Bathyarchaeota archaeon]|nr:hypothetical protein [Candidatus Bathyarchaeota archaeon]